MYLTSLILEAVRRHELLSNKFKCFYNAAISQMLTHREIRPTFLLSIIQINWLCNNNNKLVGFILHIILTHSCCCMPKVGPMGPKSDLGKYEKGLNLGLGFCFRKIYSSSKLLVCGIAQFVESLRQNRLGPGSNPWATQRKKKGIIIHPMYRNKEEIGKIILFVALSLVFAPGWRFQFSDVYNLYETNDGHFHCLRLEVQQWPVVVFSVMIVL